MNYKWMGKYYRGKIASVFVDDVNAGGNSGTGGGNSGTAGAGAGAAGSSNGVVCYYNIRYDDGDTESNVLTDKIKRIDNNHDNPSFSSQQQQQQGQKQLEVNSITPLTEGHLVEADYRGRGKYYPGRVISQEENTGGSLIEGSLGGGTVDVLYDDGEIERKVPRERVRERTEGRDAAATTGAGVTAGRGSATAATNAGAAAGGGGGATTATVGSDAGSSAVSLPIPSTSPPGMATAPVPVSSPVPVPTYTITTITHSQGPGAVIRLSAGEHKLTVTFTPSDTTLPPVSLTRPLRVRKAITRVCWSQPSPMHVCEKISKAMLDGYIETIPSNQNNSISNPYDINDNNNNDDYNNDYNNAIIAASAYPSLLSSPSSSSSSTSLPRGLSASFLQYSSVGLYSVTVPDEVGSERGRDKDVRIGLE